MVNPCLRCTNIVYDNNSHDAVNQTQEDGGEALTSCVKPGGI